MNKLHTNELIKSSIKQVYLIWCLISRLSCQHSCFPCFATRICWGTPILRPRLTALHSFNYLFLSVYVLYIYNLFSLVSTCLSSNVYFLYNFNEWVCVYTIFSRANTIIKCRNAARYEHGLYLNILTINILMYNTAWVCSCKAKYYRYLYVWYCLPNQYIKFWLSKSIC